MNNTTDQAAAGSKMSATERGIYMLPFMIGLFIIRFLARKYFSRPTINQLRQKNFSIP